MKSPRLINADDTVISLSELAKLHMTYRKKQKVALRHEWALFDVSIAFDGYILTIPKVQMKMDLKEYF